MAVLLPIFVYGAIVVGLLSFLTFRYSRRRLYALAEPIPGRPVLPLIGNAHQFAGSTKDILSNIEKIINFTYEHGVSKTWLGPKLYLAITDPATAEIVLNTEMNKAGVYGFMRAWLGNGLVTSTEPVWKRHRKMLSPTFGQKILDGFVSIFAEQSEILTEKMAKEVGKGTFDIFKYIGPCTLDVICESAMGYKIEAQNNKNTSYIEAGLREMRLVYQRMFQIWLQPEWLFNLTPYKRQQDHDLKILHDFTDVVVKKKTMEFKRKQEALKNGTEYIEKSERKAFLDSMIEFSENDNVWSNVELREEVDTMTIAGNDTTAHASCYVLTILACLPHIQEKVVDELREIYGQSKRQVVREDLSKMVYLERVIKETFRVFPIVPIVVRELTKDIKLENYTLPAGADCVVAIIGMHKDRRIWGENVDEFDPDRFLPENASKRHPYSFIPFSSGPRNCIGKQYAMMSVKSLVSTVLRTYRLHSDLDYKTIPLKSEVILKPANGHLLSIERRTEF